VRQFCGPIFFTTSLESARGNVLAGGSFDLVDTGTKKVLVTCYHVWEGFEKERLAHPGLNLCLCLDVGPPVVFSPDMPIDAYRRLDLAVFDMDPYLAACAGRKFFPLNEHPPQKVNKGDEIFFIGFSGHMRIERSDFVAFGRQGFGLGVCSVDGFRFHADASRIKSQGDEFRGISGCPCFKVRRGYPIKLVGFASELNFDYLQFTHSLCLNKDGTLIRPDH